MGISATLGANAGTEMNLAAKNHNSPCCIRCNKARTFLPLGGCPAHFVQFHQPGVCTPNGPPLQRSARVAALIAVPCAVRTHGRGLLLRCRTGSGCLPLASLKLSTSHSSDFLLIRLVLRLSLSYRIDVHAHHASGCLRSTMNLRQALTEYRSYASFFGADALNRPHVVS